MSKKNYVIIIPTELKDSREKVKFCYLALRNLVYYTYKGLCTYTKGDKYSRNATIKNLVNSYLDCHKQHNTLTGEEIDLIKHQFDTEFNSTIIASDYILNVEQELGFNKFAFYCNCMIELSYHICEDYCNDEYIISLVRELSNKMLVNIGKFDELILQDAKNILQFISDLH